MGDSDDFKSTNIENILGRVNRSLWKFISSFLGLQVREHMLVSEDFHN